VVCVDEVLEQLKDGVRRFQREVYPLRASVFAQAAAEQQRPQTLFITCADSRIDPNEITSSGTGDVFVTRNIGNMVPAYGEMLGGVSAVVEFAVSSLGVKHIVVCGHSDCGAMKALLQPQSVEGMPTVQSWLKNAAVALKMARTLQQLEEGQRNLLDLLTEQNVLLQMEHLKSHPSVMRGMTAGGLTISGWTYDIGSGQVSVAEDGELGFTPVGAAHPSGRGPFWV